MNLTYPPRYDQLPSNSLQQNCQCRELITSYVYLEVSFRVIFSPFKLLNYPIKNLMSEDV